MSIGPAEPDDLDSCFASSSVVAMVTPSRGLRVSVKEREKSVGRERGGEVRRKEERWGEERRGKDRIGEERRGGKKGGREDIE